MAIHRDLSLAELHAVNAFSYANASERQGAALTAADVGKICVQTDNESVWILVSAGPNVWEELTSTVLEGEVVAKTRRIIAGAGLTGDGDLSQDRTLSVGSPPDGSIVVESDWVRVGVISNTQHGVRGGGTLHSEATGTTAGFLSAADKTKLDTVEAGATATPDPTNQLPENVAAASAVGTSQELARADHAHGHGAQAGGSLHDSASTNTPGFMTAGDKVKLDGIETGATRILRTGQAPPAVAATGDVGAASEVARADHTHSHGTHTDPAYHAQVSQTAHGFMSSGDKQKLDGIEAQANNTTLSDTAATVLGTAAAGTSEEAARADHAHSHGVQGGGTEHSAATQAAAGFMAAADKTKLDSLDLTHIPSDAEKLALLGTSGAPSNTNKFVTDADARLDDDRFPTEHASTHGSAGSDPITIAATQITGLEAALTSKADDNVVVKLSGDQAVAGVKTFSSLPVIPTATPTLAGQAASKSYVDAQMSALSGTYGPAMTDVAALRAVAVASIEDMQMRLVESKGALYRFDSTGTADDDGDATLKPTDAGATGRWFKTQAATQDHETLVNLKGGAADDHQHLTTTQVGYLPSSDQKAALAGTQGSPNTDNRFVTSTDLRLTNDRYPTAHKSSHLPDGVDGLATASPVPLGTVDDPGDANAFSRSDHVHLHGDLPGGSNHAVASQSVPGFMSAGDKTKLDGVANNATNSPLGSATPSTLGTAGAGSASNAAREDHVHAHGAQSDGAMHAVVTQTVHGFMDKTDKAKLDGITPANIPSTTQKEALTGTSGAPGTDNKFVTDSDSRLDDDRFPTVHASTHAKGGTDELTIDVTQIANLLSGVTSKADDTATVHKTGDENVAGVKTFSSSPVVPTPTTNMQAATKKYVDDVATGLDTLIDSKADDAATTTALGLRAIDTTVVHKTGDEVVAGEKTFSSSPIVPAPLSNMQASTKKYVDDAVAPKADSSAMTTALGLKADASAMTTALGTKADASATTSALALKAAITYVDSQDALKANDNAVVKLAGDQNVGGVKTFSSLPIVPTATPPSAEGHVASKKYVDDTATGLDSLIDTKADAAATSTAIGLKADDNVVVKTSGAQNIAGVKTFSALPQVPVTTPTVDAEVASKKYVDAQVSAVSGSYAAPVADIAGLKGTGSATPDKQLRLVESSGALFRYDTASTDTADDISVVIPTGVSGPGRWIKVQAATQDHTLLLNKNGEATYQHLTNTQVGYLPTADEKASFPAGATGTNKLVTTDDTRLGDDRFPTHHASTHGSAGDDQITIAQTQVTGLGQALLDKADAAATTTALGLKAATTYVDTQDALAVKKAGAENITGIKTFATGATPIITDAPATDLQAANKKYVDDQNTAQNTTLNNAIGLKAATTYVDTQDGLAVHKAGAENITGVKTFATGATPIITDVPASDTQAANKKYVDDSQTAQNNTINTALGLKADKTYVDTADGLAVHLAGPENIAGVKTFTVSPIVPETPSGTAAAVSKSYVDGKVSAVSGTYAAAVQTLQNLKDVAAIDRADKQLRLVEDAGALYRYDSTGTGAEDGNPTYGIIIPADTVGRWFKVQAATQLHNNLSSIQGGAAGDYQHLTATQVSKLTNIEANAQVNPTDAAILAQLKNVDGANSGIDADLLDGQHGAYYADIPTRLGYTPLDRAGGTMTGALSVSHASGVSSDSYAAYNSVSAKLRGAVADGAGAVGTILDNSIALTAGKLVSFRSATIEKGHVDYAGEVYTGSYKHWHAGNFNPASYQPVNNELTALSSLSDTAGFMKKTGDGGYTIDTNAYLTGNQNISVTGDATGSGATGIALTLATVVTANTKPKITYNAKGLVTGGADLVEADIPALSWAKITSGKPTTASGYGITLVATDIPGLDWNKITSGKPTTLLGYGITDAAGSGHNHDTAYQPKDNDLTAIANIADGTGGFLKRNTNNTWALDANTYLTANQAITLTGDVTGTGNGSFVTALKNIGTAGTYTKVTTDAQGRVSAGASLDATDIPALNWSKITTGKPTDLSGYGITNAYTKTEVDNLVSGLDFKASAHVATTGNITLSGTQTIDGVAVVAGDRVLVKDQTTASQNGIYVVAAGAWSRATDADTTADVTPGMYCFIEEGAVNGNSGWVLTTDAPVTLDTTPLLFTQFNGLGQVSVGSGLYKSGNTIGLGTSGTNYLPIANGGTGAVTAPAALLALGAAASGHTHDYSLVYQPLGSYQPLNNELTGLSNLVDTAGFVKKTGNGTYAVDINTYLTAAVTSVGLSLPSIFSVSGSPVTASGTLTAALATQNPTLVFAGPISGGAAAPTFRALASTDIPLLNQDTTGKAGKVANALSFSTAGTGDTTSFDGSAVKTISYNSVGAASSGHSHDYSALTTKPTTLSGFSIAATDVTGQLLTNYVVGGNTAIAATDSILGAFQKIQGQLNNKQASGAYLTANQNITISGDGTSPAHGTGLALTLNTVNANVGSYGGVFSIPTFTVNAKGLVTAAGTAIPATSRTYIHTVTPTAGYTKPLSGFFNTEGTVQVQIAVKSITGGHSGTKLYIFQGGFSAVGTSWSKMQPAYTGRGHGESTAGFDLYVRRGADGYTFEFGAASNTTAKTLHVTFIDVANSSNRTDISGAAEVVNSSAGDVYSHRTASFEGPVGIGKLATANMLDVLGTVAATAFSGPLTGDVTGNVSGNAGGTAANATKGTITDDVAAGTDHFPLFAAATSGSQSFKSASSKLKFVPSTGVLTATGFAGNLTGNASGTASNVTGTVLVDHGGTGAQTFTAGYLKANGTNAFTTVSQIPAADVNGTVSAATDATNATKVAVADDTTTGAYHYLAFVSGTTSNLPVKVSSTKLVFNPLSGYLGIGTNAPTTGIDIHSPTPNGANAIGTIIDTAVSFVDSSSLLLAVRNNTGNRFTVAYDGTGVFNGSIYAGNGAGTVYAAALAAASVTITGSMADGASAVAATINSTNAFSNATSRLLSIKNAGNEKAWFDYAGNIITSAGYNALDSTTAAGYHGLWLGATTRSSANYAVLSNGTDVFVNAIGATGAFKFRVQNSDKASISYIGKGFFNGLDAAGATITSVGSPVNDTDAVNKAWVVNNYLGKTNPVVAAAVKAAFSLTNDIVDNQYLIHTTGDETLGGVKTFSSYPKLSTYAAAPTLNEQFTPKKYVDDAINTAVSNVTGTYAAAVADTTALANPATAPHSDRMIRLVEASGALFRYDADSGAGQADTQDMIRPTDVALGSNGRWYKIQAATQTVLHSAIQSPNGVTDVQHLTAAQVGYLPSAEQKAALAGTNGTPNGTDNKYVTAQHPVISASSWTPATHSHNPGDGTNSTIPASATSTSTAAAAPGNPGGSATNFSRGDHQHFHGFLDGGANVNLHALATITTAGFLSATDKDKLNKIDLTAGTSAVVTDLNADKLDSQHGSYYTDIPARLGYTPLDSSTNLSARGIGATLDTLAAGVAVNYFSGTATSRPSGMGSNDGLVSSLKYDASWASQMATDFRTNEWYVRVQTSTVWGAWRKLWHEGNFNPASYATLLNPSFSGTPRSVTPSVDDNDTKIATTAFYAGQAGSSDPAMDGTASPGSGLKFARSNHVHPSDTNRMGTTNPSFTGTMSGTAATLSGGLVLSAVGLDFGSYTGQLIDLYGTSYGIGIQGSTQYFRSASRFSWHRGGVHSDTENAPGSGGTVAMTLDPSSNLYVTGNVFANSNQLATLAGPALTGTPTAPTAAPNTNTGQIATCAYVMGQGYATLASPSFTGNVGIGRTDAANPLHVVSPYVKTDTSARQVASFNTNEALASNPFQMGFGFVGNSTAATRTAWIQTGEYGTSNGGNLALQAYGGFVGIGTLSPGTKLHLNGGVFTINGAIAKGSAEANLIKLGSSTGGSSDAEFLLSRTAANQYSMQAVEQGVGYRDILLQPNGGNVGIGVTSTSEKLEISGNAKATDFIATSDERLKENIETIPDALGKVLGLRGVNYSLRSDTTHEKKMGVIAQEVEKVCPEVVHTDDKGMKTVSYGSLVGVLIEGMKAQNETIKKQQEQINQLMAMVAKLTE